VLFGETVSLRDQLENEMRAWRLGAVLFSAFGALALVLATLGLYAVISFDVSQQMREMGLRAALGASSRRLLLVVLSRALVVAIAGLILGVSIAWAAAPRLSELVFAVSPRDPLSLAGVALVLLGTALIAALRPATRAARVDPVLLIRSE
jgi:ABC-type antimicrobial peptide transport system permease subunit